VALKTKSVSVAIPIELSDWQVPAIGGMPTKMRCVRTAVIFL
jgi:hypothetical protein